MSSDETRLHEKVMSKRSVRFWYMSIAKHFFVQDWPSMGVPALWLNNHLKIELIMHPILNIAISAARKAGDIMLRSLDRLDTINVQQKRANDFVSDVDKQAEQAIVGIIRKAYPDHKIIGEEGGEQAGTDDSVWIIDPLDGTNNYIHGFPHFSVSIAFQYKGKVQHGLIYDPIRQEFFTATRGAGARLNDRRLRVSETNFNQAFLATGFPFRDRECFARVTPILQTLFQQVGNLRCAGSAALDLAYVAAGRLDGFWELNLRSWDVAAGSLLVKEAGGMVSDFSGGENYLDGGSIVASNAKLFKELLAIVHTQK